MCNMCLGTLQGNVVAASQSVFVLASVNSSSIKESLLFSSDLSQAYGLEVHVSSKFKQDVKNFEVLLGLQKRRSAPYAETV